MIQDEKRRKGMNINYTIVIHLFPNYTTYYGKKVKKGCNYERKLNVKLMQSYYKVLNRFIISKFNPEKPASTNVSVTMKEVVQVPQVIDFRSQ